MIALALKNWKLLLGGIALAALSLMLVFARMDARHWEKVATAEKAAHAQTVANTRAAAKQAALDAAKNVIRVQKAQTMITEEITHDYQARLADARRRAAALGLPRAGEADPGSGATARLPALPVTAGGPDAAPREDRLSLADRLTATETALRLDALQKWVRAQSQIDVNGQP